MSPAVPLATLTAYLDDYLRIRALPDEANAVNGLQVENAGTVTHVVAAVDASQETIDSVQGPGLLLVHHGLFWDGNIPVTGRRYHRIRALFEEAIAAGAVHEVVSLSQIAHKLIERLRSTSALSTNRV